MIEETKECQSIPPLVPERLPEEDAFLYIVGFDQWIEIYCINRKTSELDN